MCLSHCLCDVKGRDECQEEAARQEEKKLAKERRANLKDCLLNCKAEVWYTCTQNRSLFMHVLIPQNAMQVDCGMCCLKFTTFSISLLLF